MYLSEWVMTAGEAGTYTKHKFFLKMPNVSSVLLFDVTTWAIFVNNPFSSLLEAQKTTGIQGVGGNE